MMENDREGLVISAEEDRISNLPEHLIDLVLERLPIDDAVRTSILSKKWRYTWTTMRSLVFYDHFFYKFRTNGAFGRYGFIRIINKVLNLHSGPILKFVLDIPKRYLDSFEELDLLILLLSRNGVRELILTNSDECYELPCYMFSCLELTELELNNCYFKPPLEFKGCPNLEELSLIRIDFGANLCDTQIKLPQLKKLFLYECTNVHNFNIKAPKLWSSHVISCPDAMLLRLLDSPCITKAVIQFWEPIKDFVQVENMNLATLLSNLPRVSHFCIDSHFLKYLAAQKIPKLLPCEISSLNELHLCSFQLGDLDQLHGALCLLRNSPNLESFGVYMDLVNKRMSKEPRVDEGPASNHLESPNCLDCKLNRLQTVEICFFEGSRPELLFIKLLLAHSPSLKKFTIRLNETFDAIKRLDIEKDVMQFPRASTKAKVFYLKFKP